MSDAREPLAGAGDGDGAAAAGAPADGVRPRRPYAAPRILSREPLESVAAVCAPHPPAKGNPGLCPMGPISS